MNKKKILIISITSQDTDPRVIRQINFLKDKYNIYCCGISNKIIPSENFYTINSNSRSFVVKIVSGSLILLRMFKLAEHYILNSKLKIKIKSVPEFELIIANDMNSVPLAYKKFRSEKVLADFHEYAPEEFGDKSFWKLIHRNYIVYQIRKYFPVLSAATTVCNSIADEYRKNFGIRPVVITNAAEYWDLKPGPVKDQIRIIHHGAAISSRKIEIMIEAVKLLDDRFTFDLMLIPNEKNYFNKLRELTKDQKNIRMIEPVSFNEIIPFCNSYDIGLFILPPVNLNYRYALPNKFFEFIQSRLAIITGPSAEMKIYVSKYKLGISTDSYNPEDVAREINALSDEQIRMYKNNSHKNAKILSSEKNKILLNNLVNKL